MILEEIKKECKIVINEEKKGEELYFEDKPEYEKIKILKMNGYRWHNTKKCWYRKLDYKGNDTKEQKNYLDVKVGDIFCFSWGYDQANINYFEVVALKGTKQVIIREIGYEITETTGYESYKVRAVEGCFLESSQFIKDNNIGAVKQVKSFGNGKIYINIDSFGSCSLWDGTDDVMTSYY